MKNFPLKFIFSEIVLDQEKKLSSLIKLDQFRISDFSNYFIW